MMSQMLQTVAQFSGVAIENTLLHLRQFMEMVSNSRFLGLLITLLDSNCIPTH
jgi:hypothetical protein